MSQIIRISVLALISLSGCAIDQAGRLPEGFEGNILEVNKPVMVPAEAYSVQFQNGQQVDEREIVIWNHYCKVLFPEERSENWIWDTGRYQVIGYQWSPELCGWDDCDLVERFRIKTLSGTPIANLSCRYHYIFNDPVSIMGPDLLDATRLDAVLGDYLDLRPSDD